MVFLAGRRCRTGRMLPKTAIVTGNNKMTIPKGGINNLLFQSTLQWHISTGNWTDRNTLCVDFHFCPRQASLRYRHCHCYPPDLFARFFHSIGHILKTSLQCHNSWYESDSVYQLQSMMDCQHHLNYRQFQPSKSNRLRMRVLTISNFGHNNWCAAFPDYPQPLMVEFQFRFHFRRFGFPNYHFLVLHILKFRYFKPYSSHCEWVSRSRSSSFPRK